jgi:GAF domain-containing protein
VRAAYRDLQTALAHPQLRSAVLLALRAFAQAAQVGATTSRPAEALKFPFVELGPNLLVRYDVQALTSVHGLHDLLYPAIQRALARLEVEGGSMMLLDEARQELYYKVAYDPRAGREQRLREVRFPATQGIAGWVLREGRSLIVPDVDRDPRFYRGVDVQTGTQTRSLVCVPVRTQERVIGVLQAINKRQGVFTAEDVRRLEALAHQVASALEHARVLQERYHLDVQ